MSGTSFTHIVNPFPARPGSEHAVASRITFETLRRAAATAAEARIEVEVRAVVAPGDERAIEPPATHWATLERDVRDVRAMKPSRPLPLIGDLLALGARGCRTSHLVFTNMDISVQPDFYPRLARIVEQRLAPGTPFIVYRRNIDKALGQGAPLDTLYAAPGEVAGGFDCFVFPTALAPSLDLGTSCIGAPHFDLLLLMNLDQASGYRLQRLADEPLTFHLGNDIEWARNLDHIEHNLGEALAAIERLRARGAAPRGSVFEELATRHFAPNARWDSRLLRKAKRIPGLADAMLRVKRMLGRSY